MSNNVMHEPVWLVGTGSIARDYVKVMKALNIPFIAIGRSEKGVKQFIEDTGANAVSGGLEVFLNSKPDLPSFAINAVQADLGSVCICRLLDYGVKRILAEKPTGMSYSEVKRNADLAKKCGATVVAGYNRRFYASTMAAMEIIKEDGGVSSFNFEFTELYRVISKYKGDVSGWFFGNSTHVTDLAFYLGGIPKEMKSYGKSNIGGYDSTVVFSGAGVSENEALFSYQSNYLAPGRWSVEVLTSKHRLIFRPMEQLHIQKLGSFEIEKYEIDDILDREYKPGLFLQVKTFLDNPDDARFLNVEQQAENMKIYEHMHSANINLIKEEKR